MLSCNDWSPKTPILVAFQCRLIGFGIFRGGNQALVVWCHLSTLTTLVVKAKAKAIAQVANFYGAKSSGGLCVKEKLYP